MSPANEEVVQWIEQNKPPAALFLYLHRTIERYLAKELAPYHIGWEQFAILMAFYEKDGRTEEDFVRERGFDRIFVAENVAVLEKGGLVQRAADPGNKAGKRLTLTQKGRTLEPEMKKIGAGLTASLLKGFDADAPAQAMTNLKKIAINASRL
jgi:DNA-binding MarR family transcriptional regulator